MGMALAVLTAFLIVWTTIVRDDGTGEAYFMVILAIGACFLAAGGQAVGMAKGMLGVAAMQVVLGLLVATAPSTAELANGPLRALAYNGIITALWLGCAALFAKSAPGSAQAD